MKPIWYLDVDGVINMLRFGSRVDGVPKECLHRERVNGFPILWDTRVVEFLNRVHREGLVEICWLTTWEEAATRHLAPALGIDQFRLPHWRMVLWSAPQLAEDPERPHDWWWKFESVLRHADVDHLNERAVIWTDDDLAAGIATDIRLRRWVRDRKQRGLRTLGISPESTRGLTMEHLEEIERVLDIPAVPQAERGTAF